MRERTASNKRDERDQPHHPRSVRPEPAVTSMSSSTAPATSSTPTSHRTPSLLLRTPGCPGTAQRGSRTNPTATSSGVIVDHCTATTPTANTSGPRATTEGAGGHRRKSPATSSRNRERRIPGASTAKSQRVQGREMAGSESRDERETVRGATSAPVSCPAGGRVEVPKWQFQLPKWQS